MSFFKNNRKFLAGILSFLLFFIFLMPILSYAKLVTCDGTTSDPCNFDKFIGMINGIINWIISIAGVIFTISCIYGGFLYMTSGDNPGNKAKARSILSSTLTGFVIILVAWLIVYTILHTLAPDNTSILMFIKRS